MFIKCGSLELPPPNQQLTARGKTGQNRVHCNTIRRRVMSVESDDSRANCNELQPKTQRDKVHSCATLVLNWINPSSGEECCLIYHGYSSNAIWAHYIQNPFHVHWYFWYAKQSETLGLCKGSCATIMWSLKKTQCFQCFIFVSYITKWKSYKQPKEIVILWLWLNFDLYAEQQKL